jgi:CxxC motif-containing protein (DUF1111 family)
MEAIVWHGGEAKQAQEKVLAMSRADRDRLTAFIQSL